MDSYDIIADKVRSFWKETYPQDVIAFFFQKYDFESEWQWEYCEELASPNSSDDYETVIFETDFCEGQTEVTDVKIVSLEEIIQFYRDNFREENSNGQTYGD